MIKEAIVKIVNKEDLTYDEAYAVMNEIMSGETTPTQNAAFLSALSTKSARSSAPAATTRTASISPPPPRWSRRRPGSKWPSTATGRPPRSAARRTASKRWA